MLAWCSADSRSYRYTVNDDGTFGNRQTFAFISPGGADGEP